VLRCSGDVGSVEAVAGGRGSPSSSPIRRCEVWLQRCDAGAGDKLLRGPAAQTESCLYVPQRTKEVKAIRVMVAADARERCELVGVLTDASQG